MGKALLDSLYSTTCCIFLVYSRLFQQISFPFPHHTGCLCLCSVSRKIIRHKLIPAVTGISAINDSFRDLLSLPTHVGGMGIAFPPFEAKKQYHDSIHILSPLIQAIINHSPPSFLSFVKNTSKKRNLCYSSHIT